MRTGHCTRQQWRIGSAACDRSTQPTSIECDARSLLAFLSSSCLPAGRTTRKRACGPASACYELSVHGRRAPTCRLLPATIDTVNDRGRHSAGHCRNRPGATVAWIVQLLRGSGWIDRTTSDPTKSRRHFVHFRSFCILILKYLRASLVLVLVIHSTKR